MTSSLGGRVFGIVLQDRLDLGMPGQVLGEYLAPWSGAAGQQRWIDQVAAVSYRDTVDVVSTLDRMAVPTMVLWGERDEWLRPEVGDRLAAQIPGATRETVPDAGHFVAEDNPGGTAAALLRFFGRS